MPIEAEKCVHCAKTLRSRGRGVAGNAGDGCCLSLQSSGKGLTSFDPARWPRAWPGLAAASRRWKLDVHLHECHRQSGPC